MFYINTIESKLCLLLMDDVALYCAFLLFLINVLFTGYIQQADLLLVSVLVGHIVANTEPH